MTALLPAILALAAIDAVNPTSISGAIYLAGSRRPEPLRLFIIAVYSTYLAFGLALAFGPAAALRSALAAAPDIVSPLIEVGVGGLLIALGVRAWRRRGVAPRSPANAVPRSPRSGLTLGFLATLADLPTAGPLLVATALLAGVDGWERVSGLGLYAAVYVSPLVAIALAHCQVLRALARPSAVRFTLRASAPRVAALCVAGALVGVEGVAALL